MMLILNMSKQTPTRQVLMGTKEAYQEKIAAQLREWTARINELKDKAEGAKADAKIEMNKRLDPLRVKQEEAQAKFQALK
jgi:hypothetical protein